MRKVIQNVNKIEKNPLKTADTVNYEGAKAWKKDNAKSLMQLMHTGTLGTSFYASQRDLVEQAIDVIKEADAENLYQAIISGRNDGFIRTAPILGLVYLSLKDKELFKKAFNQVIRTGGDLEDYIGMNKGVRGFGRVVKDAMKNWIETKGCTPFYAQKYKRQISDCMRICHFPAKKDVLYDYILGTTYGVKEENEKNIAKAMKKYPALGALDEVKNLLKDGNTDEAMKLIEEYRLDASAVIGIGNLNNKIWDSLAKSMGVMMFLKYINKLDSEGTFQRQSSLYKEKITVDNLKGAKVFPFRLYTAFENITNPKIRDHFADVLDEYVQAYSWEGFKGKKWAICPDVSGSMTSSVKDSAMKPSLVAGLFTGMLFKGIGEDAMVIPWDTRAYEYRIPRRDSIISHIKEIAVNSAGGGTQMNTPVDYLIDNNINDIDVFLGVTDSEEWSNSGRGYWGSSGRSWIEAWTEYKKQNKNAIAILIRVDPYVRTQPFSEEQAKKLDIYEVHGWNDSALSWMKFILS